jgi:hypothetical protein
VLPAEPAVLGLELGLAGRGSARRGGYRDAEARRNVQLSSFALNASRLIAPITQA